MRRFKLAFLTSHPIQYQVPLFRKLTAMPEIDLNVYFCSELSAKIDPGFGLRVQWDVPLFEGYPYKFLRNLSILSDPQRFWSFINPSIIREIITTRPDAVLLHGYGIATSWLALGAAQLTSIPVILHGETVLRTNDHRAISPLKQALLSLFFRFVSAFLFIGSRSREFYRSFRIADDRLFFCPYSVDNEFFISRGKACKENVHEAKRELGLPLDEPVILYASKLTRRKRPMDCLEAFGQIQRAQGKGCLVFVGDGEMRGELEYHARQKAIEKVFFTGFKNQSELPQYYAIADVFVLPSSFETWGLVVNEAMCFGLPVITTDAVAASVDLVQHGQNGFVYSAGDIESLRRYTARLLSSNAEREDMGKKSLERIATWNYDRCIDGILKALDFVTMKG